jgi:type II secretory pathway pseudopilin PulG
MKISETYTVLRKTAGRESGDTLINTLIAIAIISIVTVTFLGGLATSSKAAFTSDKQTTAGSLARTQMEMTKNAVYVYEAVSYTPAPIPDSADYTNYSASITAQPLHNPDDGIQKITVTVSRNSGEVLTITGYKVDRGTREKKALPYWN